MREKINEWDTEPNRVEWKDEATGYTCLIVRNDKMGNLCGYVAVSPGHPAHGKPYDDIEVSVHGGLTYSHECRGEICRTQEPGEPEGVYWLGFDCAHSGDLVPGLLELTKNHGFPLEQWGNRYRNIAYVKAECVDLARQLKDLV